MRWLVILELVLAAGLMGCASPEPHMLPLDEEAAGATGSSMYFRKPMPDHRDAKPWEFYYKHCDTNGEQVYFSKTAYDCSGPSIN